MHFSLSESDSIYGQADLRHLDIKLNLTLKTLNLVAAMASTGMATGKIQKSLKTLGIRCC